ncbi:ER degradation-enhancing alpha-mannosidase-like protein 2 [Anopheles nili]|uniref:ER degradation-enhancing alpha-mannosidase-like protein 2 n=1 Tax=Anopheles nili TaxID=185578 RepID=UPI00237ACA9A|nr:ER degradation-enhancing alpha-mannosidase-like protein 2 [Anopheles nili]
MLQTRCRSSRYSNCTRWSLSALVWCCISGWFLRSISQVQGLRKYSHSDILRLRERVQSMFQHAYDGYLQYGAPYDELRPLSCDAVDTWGSYSLTLIDALDTLAVMGNYTEFGRVVQLLADQTFDADINVSVFETNIRIIGGLLSAHLLSNQADLKSLGVVEPGWPCEGPLLRLAEDVAQRLLPAFDTATGMPYGTVNLRHGVPYGETTVTCTAGIGTFILEFGTLSRLTGNPVYEDVAMHALTALYEHRSTIGLYGNHIDVQTGRWIAQDAGIGAGVDSYFEYLVKGSILLEKPSLFATFLENKASIDRYLKREDWYVWVSMSKGQLTLPVFQSLEAYWPGLLSLYGNTKEALRVLHSYQTVWRQYGFLPEFYNIPTGEAGTNRENYPLRPELIESVMYLYRATGDPFLLEVGENILESIEHSAKTACGYATIRNVITHQQEDRMESFFLAETTKYLYLLFDSSNFLHNDGRIGNIVKTKNLSENLECVVDAGGYIFNTEAHPIDPMALRCCEARRSNIFENAPNPSEQNVPRGELLLQRASRKAQPVSKKNTQKLAIPFKEPGIASTAKIEAESEERMATVKLPTNPISRNLDSGDIIGEIKTNIISSSVTVSTEKDKDIASIPTTKVLLESNAGKSNPSDKPTLLSGGADTPETNAKKIAGNVNNLLLEIKAAEKPFISTDHSSSLRNKADSDSYEYKEAYEIVEDKTVTTLVKLIQNLFLKNSGQQSQRRAKFDSEKFYQQLERKRLEQLKRLAEVNGNINASETASTAAGTMNVRYELLSCTAQSYLQRLTLLGEFYHG